MKKDGKKEEVGTARGRREHGNKGGGERDGGQGGREGNLGS